MFGCRCNTLATFFENCSFVLIVVSTNGAYTSGIPEELVPFLIILCP